ncbi:MAG: TlyA family RNA methyltransferase [Armatimonadota bacterium]|nr:TlyA family RNA methyltransferase [Armatimonadota bacterium]
MTEVAVARREGAGPRAPARRRAARVRLDALVVARGLAPSRHQAEGAIRSGEIFVDGRRADKPGAKVSEEAAIERRLRGPVYVSRGGIKLAAALDGFGIDPRGQVVLDVGSSTGGFTDCVLQRGARRVYAVDVGRGQLHWRLRRDPRVVVMEGRHAARLQPDDFPEPADLATIDCSFISVLKVLPAASRCVRPGGLVLALVKPQFEAGPRAAPKGVVRDPSVHEAVLRRVVDGARALGLAPVGIIPSPILGPDGNREFFLALRNGPPSGADTLDEEIRKAVWGREGAAP